MGPVKRIGSIALTLLAVGLMSGAALSQTKVAPQSREQVQLSFAPLVKQVSPSVVNIYAKRKVKQPGFSPLFNDPIFKRFFGEGFGFFGMPRERVQNSLGSGVIVDREGLVVTNYHVIKGADQIRVVLNDRREFKADIMLADEDTDLAVLSIHNGETKFPAVELGDSDNVEVGDLVLAIGNPFGVGQTVTSGIVSALARTQSGISDYSFFIQTDAATTPGNSGGALVTLDGKLVGINTAIFSRSGGSIGIGFAVPANMVRTVVASARSGREIVRPWTGLIGQTLTADLAEGFGIDLPGGVVVSQVYGDGPAARAGIRQGDVILAVAGLPVPDFEALRYRVATRELGSLSEVEVWRDGRRVRVKMNMEEAPENPPRRETLMQGRHPLSGAKVANLSPALAEEFDLTGAWEGVIILAIGRGKLAYRLGFRPGDVILTINESDVGQVSQLIEELRKPAPEWAISFRRDGRVRTVEISG